MGSCTNQIKSQQSKFKCWFLVRGENWRTRGKTSWNRVENQQSQSTVCFVCYFLLISLQLINHSKLLTQPLNYEKRLVAMKFQRRQQLLNGRKNKKQ